MVFSNLGAHEKQAFFDLLDEYFASRPELLASLGGSGGSENTSGVSSRSAAASAVHSALATNPEATANLVSSGLRHGAQNSAVKNSAFANAASNPAIASSVGRVAAASLAFQHRAQNTSPPVPSPGTRSTPPPPPAPRNVPPALPRRTSSTSQEQEQEEEPDEDALPPPGRPPLPKKTSSASGLVQRRAMGDVDTTSLKASFVSVKNSTVNKKKGPPSVAPPLPSAFQKRQNNFAPPPSRRVTSDSTPSPEPEAEPEEQGEWAEALYDYNSGEPGDLVIQAQEHVRIVSKDSEDWWTGEIDGKTGLFPASYVRVL